MNIQRPPRTEIWVRKIHAPYVEDRTLKTIFRPGRRLLVENHPKALGVGEKVRIRVVDKVGADWANLFGILLPKPNFAAEITGVTVKPFDMIKPDDFVGSSPGVKDIESLRMQLALIYNFSREELCSSLWITRTTFRYISEPSVPIL